MIRYFESLIKVYGYRTVYGRDQIAKYTGIMSGKNKEIFLPEDEFFTEIRLKGYYIHKYGEFYLDHSREFMHGTPFFSRSKIRREMGKNAIFDTMHLVDEKDVHKKRKLIVRKWLEYTYPFIECCKSLPRTKDGAFDTNGDHVLRFTFESLPELVRALHLLNARDAELGLHDLRKETLYLKNSGILDFREPKISKGTDKARNK